jgi:hypothetical protein
MLCQHRSTIAPEKVGAHDGIMREVRTLKLKCSICGGRDFRAFVVPRQEWVDRFLAKTSRPEEKTRATTASDGKAPGQQGGWGAAGAD